MKRRYWPGVIVAVTLLVFASYLAYTQMLVRRVRTEARVHSEIYGYVQQGLASPETGAELAALVRVQESLQLLGVPTVSLTPYGTVYATNNLPFEVDLRTVEGRVAALEYARELERRRPLNRVEIPGYVTIFYGDPPLLGWLNWVPWLQVTLTMVLVGIGVAVLRAQARAERERLWASMARELAHQMGTPLSSLSGWTEILRLPPPERGEMASDGRIAEVMSADVERLGRVAHRFELIGKQPQLVPTAAAEVIAEIESYFRPRLPRLGRGITLRTRVARDMPPIAANPVLLAWAIENVVKNAVDALAGRGGRIVIHGACTDDRRRVHIQIGDDGPGIAADVRDRIFEAGVSTKSAGWGVGLSLTRRIVEELHGGKVSVRARARGGTVFDIMLPVAEAAEAAGAGK